MSFIDTSKEGVWRQASPTMREKSLLPKKMFPCSKLQFKKFLYFRIVCSEPVSSRKYSLKMRSLPWFGRSKSKVITLLTLYNVEVPFKFCSELLRVWGLTGQFNMIRCFFCVCKLSEIGNFTHKMLIFLV